MAQIKMKYGIDLGTTNSAICKMENGEPTIKKTDTLKDTLPSCVSFTRRKVTKVGDSAYNDLRQDKARATKKWSEVGGNVFVEFKREMGLNTPHESSNMERSFSSEELSAEVLKTLKSFVSDDVIDSAVITIPAKFKADQIAATKRAASLAGIAHSELLQEPIAASMAYGLSSAKKDGIWLVFDFGGGTFDAALIKVEEGIMTVKDTEGNNYLGGKNLDYAVVDEIIIPYLKNNYAIDEILSDDKTKAILRDAMKFYAEQAKNQVSFKENYEIMSQLDEFGDDDEGTPIELDMVVTREQVEQAIAPIFQKAIDITIALLERNNLKGSDLDTLILVGGPTFSRKLRQMLKEQVTPNVDTSIDPMTAVAKGAALYASGIDTESNGPKVDGTIALKFGEYATTTVETSVVVPVSILQEECTGTMPAKVFVDFVRSDKGWASGKIDITNAGDIVDLLLMEGKSNSFSVIAYDEAGHILPCFPNEINIMQGIVIRNAVLPFNIGIEVHDTLKNKNVFVPFKGLEKNQPIPATGVKNGLKVLKQLRPGMSEDRLIIPIYQGENAADGTSAIYNDHVDDVVITGDDVPSLVPANSDVDVIIKVDRSQMMTAIVTIPAIGETIEKEVDVKSRDGVNVLDLENRFAEAQRKLRTLKSTKSITEAELSEASEIINDLSARFDNEKTSDDGKMSLLADMRRAFISMEKVENEHEWEAIEAELREEFDRLEKANNDLGNKYDQEVEELRQQTDMAIKKKDPSIGRQVLSDINSVFVGVTLIYQCVGFVRHHRACFNQHKWKNAAQAQQLLNQAQTIIDNGPSVDTLHPIVCSIIDLLDEDTEVIGQ